MTLHATLRSTLLSETETHSRPQAQVPFFLCISAACYLELIEPRLLPCDLVHYHIVRHSLSEAQTRCRAGLCSQTDQSGKQSFVQEMSNHASIPSHFCYRDASLDLCRSYTTYEHLARALQKTFSGARRSSLIDGEHILTLQRGTSSNLSLRRPLKSSSCMISTRGATPGFTPRVRLELSTAIQVRARA